MDGGCGNRRYLCFKHIPTPIYVIYRQQFHFSDIVLTLIYAAYVIGTVTTMFFLGRLSDQVGRRPVVLISLGIGAAGAIIFLFANTTAWLFPARILSGLAIALASGGQRGMDCRAPDATGQNI